MVRFGVCSQGSGALEGSLVNAAGCCLLLRASQTCIQQKEEALIMEE
jgi:hypothetical protein